MDSIKRNSDKMLEKLERLSVTVNNDSIRHQQFAETAKRTSIRLLEIMETYPRFKLHISEIDNAERQIGKCKKDTADLRAAAWNATYEANQHDIINDLCSMVIQAEEKLHTILQLTEAKRKFLLKHNEASNAMERLKAAMTPKENVNKLEQKRKIIKDRWLGWCFIAICMLKLTKL